MASSWDWTQALSESDKRTVVLALAYESIRKRTQFGYQVFDLSQDPTQTTVFKTFRTVEKWLDQQCVKIAWAQPTWKSYCEYVFSKLKPTVPQPGQLKNPYLLKEYFRSTPVNKIDALMRTKKLEELYRKHMRPELVANPGLMELLGFRNIAPFEDFPHDKARTHTGP